MKLLRLRLARVTTSRRWGVARVEAVLVVAVLVLLALVFVVPLTRQSQQPESVRRASCKGNLKEIARAFEMWASEHGDKFPMQLAESQGGAMEQALAGRVAPSLMRMSNELASAKILVCPSDRERAPRPESFDGLTDQKISYFIGADAISGNSQHLLAGDRNLALLPSGTQVQGLVIITNYNGVRWTKMLHEGNGNVALADGKVRQATTADLRGLLEASGSMTNRLVFP